MYSLQDGPPISIIVLIPANPAEKICFSSHFIPSLINCLCNVFLLLVVVFVKNLNGIFLAFRIFTVSKAPGNKFPD